MEFKKCERCGCFFSSKDSVCYNCLTKEKFEMSQLKSYIEENNLNNIHSLSDLSVQTGIAGKTLNRFLTYEDFSEITGQFNLK